LNRKQVKRAAARLQKDFDLKGTSRIRNLYMGGDPEFFFQNEDGDKKGAERVIGENGISSYGGTGVLDGFQAEVRITPSTCRALIGNNITNFFKALKENMVASGSDLVPDFSSVIKVDEAELNSLSDAAREFGCAPSFSSHLTEEEAAITVDPATYNVRGAGGHIHLGTNHHGVTDYDELADVMDVLLGNTCVLLDRDPMMPERRKVYGRAGEYRLPDHGFEYRVLSNFWLSAYPLMSFCFSLARYCVGIVEKEGKYVEALMSVIDIDDIRKAINDNDYDLALKNFNKVCIFLEAAQLDYTFRRPSGNKEKISLEKQFLPTEANPFAIKFMGAFRFFAMMGMDHWFESNPFDHWLKKGDGNVYATGWESFSRKILMPEYRKWLRAGKPDVNTWKALKGE